MSMDSCWILLLLLLRFSGQAHGHADFIDVRTHLDQDHSTTAWDPEEKYFHESSFHPHYDGRFAAHEIADDDERNAGLVALLRTFFRVMDDIGVDAWIMHGTLLGWWWNGRILPWDSDLDVQVSEASLTLLAHYYNMTEYHFRLPELGGRRDYLMEVNAHYRGDDLYDTLNVIDARWIDTDTGLFVDITAVRPDHMAHAQGRPGVLRCKDHHRYSEAQIFPLRRGLLENVPVKVPFEYKHLLEEEYGGQALSLTTLAGYKFHDINHRWERERFST